MVMAAALPLVNWHLLCVLLVWVYGGGGQLNSEIVLYLKWRQLLERLSNSDSVLQNLVIVA